MHYPTDEDTEARTGRSHIHRISCTVVDGVDDDVRGVTLERHSLPITDQAAVRRGAEPVGASRHARTDPTTVPGRARPVHLLDRERCEVVETRADGGPWIDFGIVRMLVEVLDRVALYQRRLGDAVDLVS